MMEDQLDKQTILAFGAAEGTHRERLARIWQAVKLAGPRPNAQLCRLLERLEALDGTPLVASVRELTAPAEMCGTPSQVRTAIALATRLGLIDAQPVPGRTGGIVATSYRLVAAGIDALVLGIPRTAVAASGQSGCVAGSRGVLPAAGVCYGQQGCAAGSIGHPFGGDGDPNDEDNGDPPRAPARFEDEDDGAGAGAGADDGQEIAFEEMEERVGRYFDRLLGPGRARVPEAHANALCKAVVMSARLGSAWIERAISATCARPRGAPLGYLFVALGSAYWDATIRAPPSEKVPRDVVKTHWLRALARTVLPRTETCHGR